MTIRRTLVTRAADFLNHAFLWHCEHRVWGQRMASASFDRWLYLRLHAARFIGADQKAALQRIVRPGMTVLDVGSNLGLYTVLLSGLVGRTGRVISFEPDPDLYALLIKNCDLNGCANVEAHNLALGSAPSRLVLRKRIFNSGANTLGVENNRYFRTEVEVEVVCIDEFLPELQPDLVKIDVQGWELEALRGMQRTLDKNREIALFLEFWPAGLRRAGCSAEELLDFLVRQNFHFYLTDSPDQKSLESADLRALTKRLTGFKYADLYVHR